MRCIAVLLLVAVVACAGNPKPKPTYHWERIPGAVNPAPLEQALGACRGQAAAAVGPMPPGDPMGPATRGTHQRQVFVGCMYGYGWRWAKQEPVQREGRR